MTATAAMFTSHIAEFVAELSQVQDRLLQVLRRKRQLIVEGEAAEIRELEEEEKAVGLELAACHERRQALLAEAAAAGLPGESLQELAQALPEGEQLEPQLHAAGAAMRLLQHESLTNWVLAQQAFLHLSQLLEIVATGGRKKPTYSKCDAAAGRGALVDRAV